MGRRKGHSRIQRLVEALRAYQPERVYLFGSWARGEEDDLSDLDVVVINVGSKKAAQIRELLC